MTVLATWKEQGLNPSGTLSIALSLEWQKAKHVQIFYSPAKRENHNIER